MRRDRCNLSFLATVAALTAALYTVPLAAIHSLDAEDFTEGFHLGQTVDCRNAGEDWKTGEIISTSPLKVKRAGDWFAHTWDDVRHKVQTDKADALNEAVATTPSEESETEADLNTPLSVEQKAMLNGLVEHGKGNDDADVEELKASDPSEVEQSKGSDVADVDKAKTVMMTSHGSVLKVPPSLQEKEANGAKPIVRRAVDGPHLAPSPAASLEEAGEAELSGQGDSNMKMKMMDQFMSEEELEEDEMDREWTIAMHLLRKKHPPPPPPTPAPERIAGHGCYVSEENFEGMCYKKCSSFRTRGSWNNGGYSTRIGKNICARSSCSSSEEMLGYVCYKKCADLVSGGLYGNRLSATVCAKADGSAKKSSNSYNRRASDSSAGYPLYSVSPHDKMPACSGYNVNRHGTCPNAPLGIAEGSMSNAGHR